MKYKLLVLDVDGTLLNDEREISKKNISSFAEGTANGSTHSLGIRVGRLTG